MNLNSFNSSWSACLGGRRTQNSAAPIAPAPVQTHSPKRGSHLALEQLGSSTRPTGTVGPRTASPAPCSPPRTLPLATRIHRWVDNCAEVVENPVALTKALTGLATDDPDLPHEGREEVFDAWCTAFFHDCWRIDPMHLAAIRDLLLEATQGMSRLQQKLSDSDCFEKPSFQCCSHQAMMAGVTPKLSDQPPVATLESLLLQVSQTINDDSQYGVAADISGMTVEQILEKRGLADGKFRAILNKKDGFYGKGIQSAAACTANVRLALGDSLEDALSFSGVTCKKSVDKVVQFKDEIKKATVFSRLHQAAEFPTLQSIEDGEEVSEKAGYILRVALVMGRFRQSLEGNPSLQPERAAQELGLLDDTELPRHLALINRVIREVRPGARPLQLLPSSEHGHGAGLR